VGAGHILKDGIQDLLLDLSDGVTVEDLHWDLRAVDIVWADTAQDLGVMGKGQVGEGSRRVLRPSTIGVLSEKLLLSMWGWGRGRETQSICVPTGPLALSCRVRAAHWTHCQEKHY
jgi:hypothetical protein